ERFVYCITNHDQVGNRAFGERLGQVIEPAAYRAASALLCLVPYTPMLFMGQEWSASSPFQFFTDHAVELGKLVTEGRRREFRHFTAFRDPEVLKRIPDPQAQSTFANSKLRWDEVNEPQHEQILQLYREFLRLRRMHPAFRDPSRGNWDVREIGGIVCLRLGLRSAARALVLIDLVGGHTMPDLSSLADGESREWKSLISSNEVRFGGDTAPVLTQPTTLVFGEAR
ncbi:MAG: DUF3459 domain-containing protein, partial [Chthoniobacterales bacterium]|nr:DUF3459 domain-containing protein [Chthoniobacterales bacterium]